jgi:hypothetical protein
MSNKYQDMATATATDTADDSSDGPHHHHQAQTPAGAADSGKGVDAASAVEQGVAAQHGRIGQNAFADLTDRENDEFVYVL